MSCFSRYWAAVPLVVTTFLTSCVSQFHVHDPQVGVIGRDDVKNFLKSIRCEINTFYDANRINQIFYINAIEQAQTARSLAEANAIRADAVEKYPHFMLDSSLAGGAYLYLKVVDTVGIGAGDTNLTQKTIKDVATSYSWGISPTLNSQNTYDMNYSFAIDQAKGLSNAPSDDDEFRCYKVSVHQANLYELASGAGDAGNLANFNRIYLNGNEPLAGWLLRNSRDLWTTYRAKTDADLRERFFPLQMNYSFSVVFSGGVGAKYSLLSSLWNPAQIGAGVSSAQTSQMSIYFNGTKAPVALTAKIGTAKLREFYPEEQAASVAAMSANIANLEQIVSAKRVAVDQARQAVDSAEAAAETSRKSPPLEGVRPDASVDKDAVDRAAEQAKVRAKDTTSELANAERQLNAAKAAKRAAQRRAKVGVGNVYGLGGARIDYPLAVPLPQSHSP